MEIRRKLLYPINQKQEVKMKLRTINYILYFLVLILSFFLMGSGGTGYRLTPYKFTEQLNLSKEQVDGYKRLTYKFSKNSKRLIKGIIKMTILLQKTLDATRVEKSNVNKLIKGITGKQSEFYLAQITLITEFRALLDRNQRQQFKTMIGSEYNLPKWPSTDFDDFFIGSSNETCSDWCGNKWRDCASGCIEEGSSFCSETCRAIGNMCDSECDRQY